MTALDKLQRILPIQEIDAHPLPRPAALLKSLLLALDGKNLGHLTLELMKLDAYEDDEFTLDDLVDIERTFRTYDLSLDAYLQKMLPIKSILENFNTELTSLSSNLKSLQQKLLDLSSNRNSQLMTTLQLNSVILDLMISPEIVKSIIEDPIDTKWLENIKFINEKIQLIESIKSDSSSPYANYKAFGELEKGINDLIAKSVERIRDFLIEQIKQLRSSLKKSSQSIQQLLLQVREIFTFLRTHYEDLANQLKLAYIYTMRWYYQSKFAKYLYALQKLSIRHIDLTLVIGYSNDNQGIFGKSWFSSAAPTPQNQANTPATYQVSMSDYLQSLDKRIEILDLKSNLAIPSQIAESTPFSYWLEFIFNQWNAALIDNIIVEYLFIVEFFYEGREKFDKLEDSKEWWQILFSPIFKIGQEFSQWIITHNPSVLSKNSNTAAARISLSFGYGTYDAFAMLLMIRLIQKSQATLHNEIRIPILDEYLNNMMFVFWPHFTKIIDANCDSMKKVIIQSSAKDLAPLNTAQQFAHFLTNLLRLSSSSQDYKGEPLYISITRLRNDFENSLTKLANNSFGTKRQAEKEIFLFNNYFLILSILKNETGMDSDLVKEQVDHFNVLVEAFRKN